MSKKGLLTVAAVLAAICVTVTGCDSATTSSVADSSVAESKVESSVAESSTEESTVESSVEESSAEESKEESSVDANQPIEKEFALTESFTHKTPDDLDYDKCDILYGDENCVMCTGMAEQGVIAKEIYIFYYAKEDKPVSCYTYYIMGDDASAAKLKEVLEQSGGGTGTVEGNVFYGVQGADELEATNVLMVSYGLMSEETASAAVEFYRTTYGVTDYTPAN